MQSHLVFSSSIIRVRKCMESKLLQNTSYLYILGSDNMLNLLTFPPTILMQNLLQVLRIELEEPTPSLGAPEPLFHHVVKYLALASCMKSKEGKPHASGNTYVQAIILKLLVIWLLDCPSVVQCFLDSRPHLTYLLELVSNSTTTVYKGVSSGYIRRMCYL